MEVEWFSGNIVSSKSSNNIFMPVLRAPFKLHFRKLLKNPLNTVSQKKGSSSGDQFQIFQIFCYGVMGRDGLTTLRPKKVRPDPLAGRPGPL